jgi:hypothetical protein
MEGQRFELDVRETFMGYIARLYDREGGMQWVRTINVNGSTGEAYDGFREYPDLFTAGRAIIADYLLDEARREQMIQQRLGCVAA